MAHNGEPMDIDNDFDNKENSIHNNNMYPRTPSTEKGYEELDVSELNMKLRYSMTPVSSPMSKSYTANCVENKNQEPNDNLLNSNLTRSYNSTISRSDATSKFVKSLPLQSVPTEQAAENCRNSTVLRPLDTAIINSVNTTITVTNNANLDDNLSIPSTVSSNSHTPEVTTPTKDILGSDGGSPIMRGLKTVLNMFRTSQSPIPPENDLEIEKQILSPPDLNSASVITTQEVLASTPIASHRKRDGSVSKRNSPLKESIVFNEDLEKELLWKDETTVLFSEEKIPIHKLFLQPMPIVSGTTKLCEEKNMDNLNSTVEYMDISYSDTIMQNKTNTTIQPGQSCSVAESDSEFLDCEAFNDDKNHTVSNDNIKSNETLEHKETEVLNNIVISTNNIIATELDKQLLEMVGTSQKVNDTTQILNDPENTVESIANLNTVNDECISAKTDVVAVDNINNNMGNTSQNVLSNSNSKIVEENNLHVEIDMLNNNSTAADNSITEMLELPKFNQINTNIISETTEIIVRDKTNVLIQNDITTLVSTQNSYKTDNSSLTENNNLVNAEVTNNSPRIEYKDSPVNVPLPVEDEEDYNLDAMTNTATTEFEMSVGFDKKFLNDNEQDDKIANLETVNFSDIQENIGLDDINSLKIEKYNNSSNVDITEMPIQLVEKNDKKALNYSLPNLVETEKGIGNNPNDQSLTKNNDQNLLITLPTIVSTSSVMTSGPVMAHDSNTHVVISETIPDLIPDTLSNAASVSPNHFTGIIVESGLGTISGTKTEDVITDKVINDKINAPENELKEIKLVPEISIVPIADQIEQMSDQPVETTNSCSTTNVSTQPPDSPKITSKGYNFNFDEIDDPFATKTKIRISPPVELNNVASPIINKTSTDNSPNRRKSQTVYKKTEFVNKNINATFTYNATAFEEPIKKNCTSAEININNDLHNETDVPISDVTFTTQNCNNTFSKAVDETYVTDVSQINTDITSKILNNIEQQREDDKRVMISKELTSEESEFPEEVFTEDSGKNKDVISIEESKSSVDSLTFSIEANDNKSSSEQSAYYSATASSGENSLSKNVFNIPEIDNINFNPFISKSKMRLSPPPDKANRSILNQSYEYIYKNKDENIGDKDYTIQNISDTTCSSKETDEKDITVQEVLTEDEDTIEGPFLDSENINIDDKMSDINDNDFMTSELPKQSNDDNLDDYDNDFMTSELPKQSNDDNLDGEMFIDADAFEFLLNQNQGHDIAENAKESLFLKFDPLFAKRVSTDGVLSILKQAQKKQSTPKKISVATHLEKNFEKPAPGPSNLNRTPEINLNITAEDSLDDLNMTTVTKPMMVVTPAVNPIVTPRNKSVNPTHLNRRSITFTSPAIAVIDRLLSLSGNNSMLGDTTINQESREQSEAELALTQLRELLADKEISVYNLRSETKELKDRLFNMESQMSALETESAERLKKINDLNDKLDEKNKINKNMAAVVEEYERTIASLIAEAEQDKKRHNEERIKLINERDEQNAHLASMEDAFSDLHSKYEKTKQIIYTYKANEDAYKKSIKEFEDQVAKIQSNYELLKQHATSKLNHANQELEKINRAHVAEVLKLNAMVKRKDVDISSLEESLAQKTKANDELAAICDELINKVG